MLTTRATKEIAGRYGGLENLGDKLMKTLRLKDVTIYARATDILLLSPSRDRMILNVGSEFQYAWVHLGVKLKF